MPATAGAMPYGQSRRVRYAASPRIFWVARAAMNSDPPTARTVTPAEKTNELSTLR